MEFETQAVIFGYAVLMGLGGWIGFKKSDSKPSLIAGVLSFAVLVVACFTKKALLAEVTSGLLSVVFFMRVLKKPKLMPSGLLLVLSAIACIYLLVKNYL